MIGTSGRLPMPDGFVRKMRMMTQKRSVKRPAAAPRNHAMRHLLLSLLLVFSASARERWVYIPADYQVDAEADRVIALLTRSRAAGYDHALITDSKFSRLGTVPERYFRNTERVKNAAAGLKIELVPPSVSAT